jgi:peptidyl-prolyl cis-trans isomerase D
MLRGLHKASAHWLGKLLMAAMFGFLALSFAIWGIGDIFRGFGASSLAKVGSTEIGIDQFRYAYNDQLQRLTHKLGRPITPDQARALRLDQQFLHQMVDEAALDERAKQLGLNLSDADVARKITADPAFHGPTGQFDRVRFSELIRANGYTEARFAAEQRRILLRRQLLGTITGAAPAPKTAADVILRFENEQRTIDYLLLGRQQAGDIPEPSQEALTKYFDEHKLRFRAPEYRKIAMLVLSPGDVARTIEVSDADAQRYYDDHRDHFGTAEKRQIEQIVFPDPEQAAAASDRIAKGTSFAELASERGLKPQDIDLGFVSKSEVLDRAVADAAFSLPEGGVSAPVKGRFGTVLLHVSKIAPEHIRSYDEVAPEVKKQIALERARPQLLDFRDKIEDARAEGLHLDEIARKYELVSRTLEADRSGRSPDGKPVLDLPSGVDVISAAFASDVNVDNEALQLPQGGFVWYDVLSITPSRDRNLDEVKDQVAASWRDDQISQRVTAKASELLDALKNGTSMADLASQQGLQVLTLGGLKRGNASGPLSVAAVDTVFQTARDAPGLVQGQNPDERLVFRVTDINLPKFDPASADAKRYGETLQRSFADDLLGEYVMRLEQDLGVSINQDALRKLHGGEAD